MLNCIRKLYESQYFYSAKQSRAGQGRLQVAKIINRAGQGRVRKKSQGRSGYRLTKF